MRYLIVSDIHGGKDAAKLINDIYKNKHVDYIIILGDILYHGPRNQLPLDYDPQLVISYLNDLRYDIVAIKGNCDAEVDEMVLDFEFKISRDLKINDLNAHLEHGHHFSEYKGHPDIFLYGHTHVPVLKEENGIIYLNPGSITLPKEGNKKTYAIWDEHSIKIYSVDGEVLKKYEY